MKPKSGKISAEIVRGDFNDPTAVLHYARAAERLGLWKSEAKMIERFMHDRQVSVLEAGCGAGRGALALWELGYRDIVGFDFAESLVTEAKRLAEEKEAAIEFHHADATTLPKGSLGGRKFGAVLFLFNGLMQIPGRGQRRMALERLRAHSAKGGIILFTTHDRESGVTERMLWRLESRRWERGEQDPRLLEFGDRYFEDEAGRTFMHLPVRSEILEDLEAVGWEHEYDALRREICTESNAVREFSDECRFWVARNGKARP